MKLLVVDGNSLLNRAFYGIKLLSTREGIYTNAIYGFITIYLKLREEVRPDAVAVAFDMRAPTFRHKQYAAYKSNRKGMPEELAAQLPVLKEILDLWGIKRVEAEGWEADDILGTLAQRCRTRAEDSCVIATGDRDSLQLAGDGVVVRLAKTSKGKPESELYDAVKIELDYGVTPSQLIDVKAIMGDSSDQIPGVAGIGEKGALMLIGQYGSLENVYTNITDSFIKESMRQKLLASKEIAFLSRDLATIRTDAPVPLELENYIPKEAAYDELTALLRKLEMFSLIDRMDLKPLAEQRKTAEEHRGNVQVLETDADEVYRRLQEEENTFFYPCVEKGILEGIAFSFGDGVHLLLREQVGPPRFETFIKEFNTESHVKKHTYHSKLWRHYGIFPEPLQMDVLLAAYLLNPSSSAYEIKRLCEEAGIQFPCEEERKWDFEIAAASVMPQLCACMAAQIEKNGQEMLLHEIEIPLSLVLADMEKIGFLCDKKGLEAFGNTLQVKLEEIEQEILEYVGYSFNLNSPKQLGEALFEKLGLPAKKKTATGYSTNAEVLESLVGSHPVIALILDYRQLSKLKSTYCEGLLKVIGEDGRIRSCFNQTETRTGRISSTEPNLQNIPIRQPLGRELRRFFIAKEGWNLIDADYSQIELRVLAAVAKDGAMIEAFRSNTDIHTLTASQVFGLPSEMVTPQLRSRAKAVNFGIVYGISAFSLANDIGVSRAEAARYIKSYFETYPGVRAYMDDVVAEAKKTGYVTTLFHRKRYLPELSSSNRNIRGFGERIARNMPIQGTAADIIKMAMIRVHRRFQEENMQSRLILQVHDELLVESPEEETEKARDILRWEMECAFQLEVPLVTDVSVGKTWYACK